MEWRKSINTRRNRGSRSLSVIILLNSQLSNLYLFLLYLHSDPRQRRLAEKEQKKTEQPVPEKLSFKEKMKMFALESGENNTPKDKLKISRAQRDIDAVH